MLRRDAQSQLLAVELAANKHVSARFQTAGNASTLARN